MSIVGAQGVVTLAVGGGDALGEVEVATSGGTQRFLAVAPEPIEVDAPILVVGVQPGRVVSVERWIALP